MRRELSWLRENGGSLGSQMWLRTYDFETSRFLGFNAAKADLDGNLVVGGWFGGWFGGDIDGYGLAKLDSVGDTLWVRALGTNSGEIEDLLITETGDIVAVGMRHNEITQRSMPFAVRYSSEGNLVFLRDYFVGVPATTPPYRRILPWSNGEMLITINSADSLTGASRNRLLRISASGDSLETTEFTGLPDGVEFHVGATIPGAAIYLAGTRHLPDCNESFIASVQPSGGITWQRQSDSFCLVEIARDILIAPQGGLFVTLETIVHVGPGPFDNLYRESLARLTPNGDTLWTTTLGVTGDDLLSGKIDTTLGGGVVLGATVGTIVSYQFLARFDADTMIVDAVVPPRSYPHDFSLSAFPNPFNSTTTLRLNLPIGARNVTLTVSNILGQQVEHKEIEVLAPRVDIQLSLDNHPSGIYFAQAQTLNKTQTTKLVLLK